MERNNRRPLYEADFNEESMKQYVKTDLKLVHAIEITWGNGVVCKSISEQNKVGGDVRAHHGKAWFGAGYYLILDEHGQYYVCRKDIFEDEYAEVSESHMLGRIPMWHEAKSSSKLPAILPNESSMTIIDVDFSGGDKAMVPPYLTARIVSGKDILEVIYEAFQTTKVIAKEKTELIMTREDLLSPREQLLNKALNQQRIFPRFDGDISADFVSQIHEEVSDWRDKYEVTTDLVKEILRIAEEIYFADLANLPDPELPQSRKTPDADQE